MVIELVIAPTERDYRLDWYLPVSVVAQKDEGRSLRSPKGNADFLIDTGAQNSLLGGDDISTLGVTMFNTQPGPPLNVVGGRVRRKAKKEAKKGDEADDLGTRRFTAVLSIQHAPWPVVGPFTPDYRTEFLMDFLVLERSLLFPGAPGIQDETLLGWDVIQYLFFHGRVKSRRGLARSGARILAVRIPPNARVDRSGQRLVRLRGWPADIRESQRVTMDYGPVLIVR